MTGMPGTPAVSNVQVVDLDGDKRLDILGTDMRQGVIFTARRAPTVRRPAESPASRILLTCHLLTSTVMA